VLEVLGGASVTEVARRSGPSAWSADAAASDPSLDHTWPRPSNTSEGEVLGLLRRKDVVGYQIDNSPHQNNRGKRDEARVVVDYLGKGKNYGYPVDSVVGNPDEPVSGALFDCNLACLFSFPCEPHDRMVFNSRSVDNPDNHHPEKTREV